MVQCEYISLANLIAGEKLVEERLQAECNVDQLVLDLQHILNDYNRENMVGKFVLLHQKLKHNASDAAAAAIMELVNQ